MHSRIAGAMAAGCIENRKGGRLSKVASFWFVMQVRCLLMRLLNNWLLWWIYCTKHLSIGADRAGTETARVPCRCM